MLQAIVSFVIDRGEFMCSYRTVLFDKIAVVRAAAPSIEDCGHALPGISEDCGHALPG